MADEMTHSAVILSQKQRGLVDRSIRETCEHRNFVLRACNVRSNHVHMVVTAAVKPEKIASDIKSYSTRRLRQAGDFLRDRKVWSRGASTRYLWKPRYVDAAIEYVLYSQGDIPFETVFDLSDA
ncbi:MAG: transposase [Acidobacteriota bacterium]|nr:MAG: transposase [Acidobacteriota bacterium]